MEAYRWGPLKTEEPAVPVQLDNEGAMTVCSSSAKSINATEVETEYGHRWKGTGDGFKTHASIATWEPCFTTLEALPTVFMYGLAPSME